MKIFFSTFLIAVVMCGAAAAQEPLNDVVNKSTKAVGYQIGGGSTKVDLRGTDLMPGATCEAKVEAKQGATSVEIECPNLVQPSSKFGAEFLTYVLWAVSPDGRAVNLGQLLLKDGKGERKTSTPAQMFSLIVTAEPYFAVRMPVRTGRARERDAQGHQGKDLRRE